MRKILMSGTALLWSGVSWAGGYVPPIVAVEPPVAVATAQPSAWWLLALVPLLALFKGGGREGGITPLPPEYGGPCFGEGTLIEMANGTWKPIEGIKAGDSVMTSHGPQKVIAVDGWVPVEFKDRPVLFKGVKLSKNHHVSDEGKVLTALEASKVRTANDGRGLYHILLETHSWLRARADMTAQEIKAESLWLTKDMKLGKQYPKIVENHSVSSLLLMEA